MLLTLEALKAKEGDCLLLHWGTVASPRLAVIDGGPGRTYEESLRPRLDEIRLNRNLQQLRVDLAMVSHVDGDHVVGVKKLFRALRREVDDLVPVASRELEVRRLWHNTFNDVLGDAIDAYYNKLTASVQASVGGRPNPKVVDELEAHLEAGPKLSKAQSASEALALGSILAGHADGRALRDDQKFLFQANQTLVLNTPFKSSAGKPTLITSAGTAPTKIDGLEFHVVGPLEDEVEALQKHFDAFIKKKGLTAEAFLAAFSDPSITNLSSIVSLVSLGGKTILLTGDARGDKILAGLEAEGLLAAGAVLHVDVLKVPHHGSDNNVAPEFFERIVADDYVFSGDGKHGNPERETFEMLATARGKGAKYDVHLTYTVASTDKLRKADAVSKKKTFSPAKHSLKALFAKKADAGFKFKVHAGVPIKIELGDEKIPW
jgi:beta-lactamase superfamily II metal-dependent hydrolase